MCDFMNALKYKIDKLTQMTDGKMDENNPLNAKPSNVDNLDLSEVTGSQIIRMHFFTVFINMII